MLYQLLLHMSFIGLSLPPPNEKHRWSALLRMPQSVRARARARALGCVARVALRCFALLCVALLCVALRCMRARMRA